MVDVILEALVVKFATETVGILFNGARRRFGENQQTAFTSAWRETLHEANPELRRDEGDNAMIQASLQKIHVRQSRKRFLRKWALPGMLVRDGHELSDLSYPEIPDWRTRLERTLGDFAKELKKNKQTKPIFDSLVTLRDEHLWAREVVWILEPKMSQNDLLRPLLADLDKRDEVQLRVGAVQAIRDMSASIRHLGLKTAVIASGVTLGGLAANDILF